MTSYIYETFPTWLIGIVIVGGFVALATCGLLLFRRLVNPRMSLSEEMNNDIIFFASAIGVFYSLMAGLMAVAVWGNYVAVEDLVSQEASSIGAMYRDVSGLKEPARTDLRQLLSEYNRFIIDSTWPAQRHGRIMDRATTMVTELQDQLYRYDPATLGQQAIYAETLRQFNHMVELRRRRIQAIGGALPPAMWVIMLIGATLSVTVTYLLKIHTPIQVVLTAFLATFIGLVVFVMAGLDSPLTGPLAIKPHAYQVVQERLIDLK